MAAAPPFNKPDEEIVTVEVNGEIIELSVPVGTSDEDIQKFLAGSQKQEKRLPECNTPQH